MNYTQLYKKANMRKVATAELIYKVATLLKRAEQKEAVDPSKESAGLGTWKDNTHNYFKHILSKSDIHSPINRNYFSLIQNRTPHNILFPTRPLTIASSNDISRGHVLTARSKNAILAISRAFNLPSSFRNYALYELARKIGKWKEQQWKETGAVPTKMSPELDAEYKKTVKGIVLPEGRTLQLVKDIFYKNISDANKRRRHSNVG